jgi:hypothetical protein
MKKIGAHCQILIRFYYLAYQLNFSNTIWLVFEIPAYFIGSNASYTIIDMWELTRDIHRTNYYCQDVLFCSNWNKEELLSNLLWKLYSAVQKYTSEWYIKEPKCLYDASKRIIRRVWRYQRGIQNPSSLIFILIFIFVSPILCYHLLFCLFGFFCCILLILRIGFLCFVRWAVFSQYSRR